MNVRVATAAELDDARTLVFEYMAATQGERGMTIPETIDELPDVLRTECSDLASAYRSPGALLLAYAGLDAIGCVGLRPALAPGTVEVKRLYVRPDHRGGGVARALMDRAHFHAVDQGFTRIILDVMPTRTNVIDFYRRMGYTPRVPNTNESPFPMVFLERPTLLGFGPWHLR